MAGTPLDTLLIQDYTGGVNMPLASQAGHEVRVNSSGNNLEYVGPQEIAGTGVWNGKASAVMVRGSGARTITLGAGDVLGRRVLVVDADGNAGAGTITVAGDSGITVAGTATISANDGSAEFLATGAAKWTRVAG